MQLYKSYWLIAFAVAGFLSCKKGAAFTEAPVEAELSINRLSETIFFDSTQKREKKLEYGYAAFYKDISRLNGGTVSYGPEPLQPFSLGEYSLDNGNDSLNFTSKLDGGKIWSVSGNQTNKIPAFTVIAAHYPTFLQKNFDSIPVIQIGRPFTVTWDNTIPCDSLSVTIWSGFSVTKSVKASNINSVSFTASDLYILNSTGPGDITIYGRTRKDTIVDGMKIRVETIAVRRSTVKII
jgi:hypothetical protein